LLRVAISVVSCSGSAGWGEVVRCGWCYLVFISCSVLNIGDIVFKHAVALSYLSAYIFWDGIWPSARQRLGKHYLKAGIIAEAKWIY
jgi:hypothetical protein